ncbi:multidrug effflux MFS transporter [Fluviispira multicolorata]|uniref:Bcr/CflA family efflux MFS transporter n=1 Tax=Fluviispira multicolorata TaxID=2654512 RepID=A0A833JE26_9BACT|nr:multidrug effflux MFS transporter [Fluviispira multicolorata]KAB8029185.1 Bcr/CflA family efflux MFS transporter [Fluviispira multicolorata]
MYGNKIINHRIIFLVILFLVPISQVSIDIYSPSLPKIVTSLSTNSSSVQQTVSLFLISLGLGQFFYGPISDRYGRKNALLFGMILFTLSSLMCVIAQSIEFLIFARFIQGFSSASIAVLSKAVSVDLYKGIELMKATAWIGLVWGVSPIIAPVVGAYLDKFGGWRLPFIVLSVYGFISCIVILFFMKETNTSPQNLNLKRILINSYKVIRNKDFFCSTIIVAATNLGIFSFTMMGPFLIQDIMGKSQVFYGQMALLVGLVYMLGAFASRFVIKYYEGQKIIHFTSTVLLLMSVLMVILSYFFPSSIFIFMISSCGIAFASGILYPYLIAIMFAPFNNLAGTVSSNYGVISYTFSGIVTIFTGYLVITSIREVAITYAMVGIITYIAMKIMFYLPARI